MGSTRERAGHSSESPQLRQTSSSSCPSSLLMNKSTPRTSRNTQQPSLRSVSTVSVLSENAVSAQPSNIHSSPSVSVTESPASSSAAQDSDNSPQEQLLFQRLRRVSSTSLKSTTSAVSVNSSSSRRPSFFRPRDRSSSNASRFSYKSSSMISLSDVTTATMDQNMSTSFFSQDLEDMDPGSNSVEQHHKSISRRSSNASLRLTSLKHRSSSGTAQMPVINKSSASIRSKVSTESLKSSLAPPITFRPSSSSLLDFSSSSLDVPGSYDTSDASFSFNSDFNFSNSISLEDTSDIPQDVGADYTSARSLGQQKYLGDEHVPEEDEDQIEDGDPALDSHENSRGQMGQMEIDPSITSEMSPKTSDSGDSYNQPETPLDVLEHVVSRDSKSNNFCDTINHDEICLPLPPSPHHHHNRQQSGDHHEQQQHQRQHRTGVNYSILQFPLLGYYSTVLCNSKSIIPSKNSSRNNNASTSLLQGLLFFLSQNNNNADQENDHDDIEKKAPTGHNSCVNDLGLDQIDDEHDDIVKSTSKSAPATDSHTLVFLTNLFDIAVTKIVLEPIYRIDNFFVKPYYTFGRLGQSLFS